MNDSPPTRCWPCSFEGRDIASVRPIANHGYCAAHLQALYATFHPAAFAQGGIGLQVGELHPEYGPLEADLECCRCGATWTGIPGDNCGWCRRDFEVTAEMQSEALLRPPDIDPDDISYELRMRAWLERMRNGVDAKLITEDHARAAWHRRQREAAA